MCFFFFGTLKNNNGEASRSPTRSTNRQISADIGDISSSKGRQAFTKWSSSSWAAGSPWRRLCIPQSPSEIGSHFSKCGNRVAAAAVERRSSIPGSWSGRERKAPLTIRRQISFQADNEAKSGTTHRGSHRNLSGRLSTK